MAVGQLIVVEDMPSWEKMSSGSTTSSVLKFQQLFIAPVNPDAKFWTVREQHFTQLKKGSKFSFK